MVRVPDRKQDSLCDQNQKKFPSENQGRAHNRGRDVAQIFREKKGYQQPHHFVGVILSMFPLNEEGGPKSR